MAHNPRLKKNVLHFHLSDKSRKKVLTHQDVLKEAMRQLMEGIDLSRPEEAKYGAEDLWGVLLHAAAQQTTVEQTCRALDKSPHSNTVRGALTMLPLSQLEPALNGMLPDTWPKNLLQYPLEVAIDLKLIPYYGEAKPGEEDFLLTGPAKRGTTIFFGYASIYVIKNNKRFTLALAAVRRSEGLASVLQRLLQRFADLGRADPMSLSGPTVLQRQGAALPDRGTGHPLGHGSAQNRQNRGHQGLDRPERSRTTSLHGA
jgi:putative transposase